MDGGEEEGVRMKEGGRGGRSPQTTLVGGNAPQPTREAEVGKGGGCEDEEGGKVEQATLDHTSRGRYAAFTRATEGTSQWEGLGVDWWRGEDAFGVEGRIGRMRC